jgi:GrpB-like predicted nucleotidyltransferase (UPF0157 family)
MAANDPQTWRDEPVKIVEHDPLWATRFAVEADLLEATIGRWITGGIHHIGSTAVPGLDAKPIIDIAVGVESLQASRPCIEVLSKIAYLYSPYREDVMHWFCKPDPANRSHHLHLIPTGSARMEDEIVFRDYLRSHPASAAEYRALKRRLAAEHFDDREAYTKAKAVFVEVTTASAHIWRAESRAI